METTTNSGDSGCWPGAAHNAGSVFLSRSPWGHWLLKMPTWQMGRLRPAEGSASCLHSATTSLKVGW